MKNKIKMMIFEDLNHKLRHNYVRQLPNKIGSYNSLILSKGEKKNQIQDMIQITPNHKDIGKAVSFDILFLTGKYAGLFLDDVKPLHAPSPLTKEQNPNIDQEANIIPAKLIADPLSYKGNYYYFKLGEYKSVIIEPNVIMNIFQEIRQWDSIPLEEVISIINRLNQPEFLDEEDMEHS